MATWRDTYRSAAAERADHAAMAKLHKKLSLPESWLRLDECGCWAIIGPNGTIYAYSNRDGWLGGYLVVTRIWDSVKKALVPGTVRQSGDGEAVVLVKATDMPPTAVVRKAICSLPRPDRTPSRRPVSAPSETQQNQAF